MSDSSKSEPIGSISDFLEAINNIIGDKNESKLLFRGQEDEMWKVETSAYRRLKTEASHTEEDELHYNLGLIEQFKHEDFHSDYKSKIMQLDLGILAQLQHMGAATSLIDFSSNPLVALWFACKKRREPDSNGKVFILSTGGESHFEEINSFKEIENSKVRVPEQVNFPERNNILNNKKFLYWKPAHLNNRITAQQSYFLIGKREIPGMHELLIKGDCKKIILKNLSSVHRIERKTLFPDLAGFVQANSVSSSYGKKEKLVSDRIIIQHYDEIVEKDSKNPSAYNKRGVVLFNLGYYQRAVDDHTKAIKYQPKVGVLYRNRGLANIFLGASKSKLNGYHSLLNCFTEGINDYEKALNFCKDKNLIDKINYDIKSLPPVLKKFQSEFSSDKDAVDIVNKTIKRVEEILKELQGKLLQNRE